MTLIKKTLEDALKNMPKTTDKPPAANVKAAENLAKAFEKYFKNAFAGSATVTLSYATLAPILLATMTSNTVMQTLGTSFQAWALTWVWAGGGMAGAPGSTIALGPVLDTQLVAFIAQTLADKSNPPKDNTAVLANKIHTWATTPSNILANLINSSGAVVPTPIS